MENKWWLAFFAEIKYPAADLTACPACPWSWAQVSRAGYKIVGPCPVMNVPVKQLYLSLITTFLLFMPGSEVFEALTLSGSAAAICNMSVSSPHLDLQKNYHLLVALGQSVFIWFSEDLFSSKYSSSSDRTSYFKPRTFFQSWKKMHLPQHFGLYWNFRKTRKNIL